MAKKGRNRRDRAENSAPTRAPQRTPLATVRRPGISDVMQHVRDTTPGVHAASDSRMSRAPALPSKAMPERGLETPGEAWDRAQNRSPLTDARTDRPLDDRRCKSKPSAKRGGGKGRPFVPWCK